MPRDPICVAGTDDPAGPARSVPRRSFRLPSARLSPAPVVVAAAVAALFLGVTSGTASARPRPPRRPRPSRDHHDGRRLRHDRPRQPGRPLDPPSHRRRASGRQRAHRREDHPGQEGDPVRSAGERRRRRRRRVLTRGQPHPDRAGRPPPVLQRTQVVLGQQRQRTADQDLRREVDRDLGPRLPLHLLRPIPRRGRPRHRGLPGPHRTARP